MFADMTGAPHNVQSEPRRKNTNEADKAVARAAALAKRAHSGQTDKSGHPYIEHPARVAALVESRGGSTESMAVAWLHDVVEDSAMTLTDLAEAGMPSAVIAGVDAITKRTGEERAAYLARVRENPLALSVKTADVDDNTDPGRIRKLDTETQQRLRVKYAETRAALGV